MKFRVFDSETDGLAYECTKIHVLSWTDDGKSVNSTNDYDIAKEVLTHPDFLLVGHNAVMFDMVVFNRILGLNLNYCKFVDTLALSWVLYPERIRHGLEYIGLEHGIEKPFVEDWKNLTYEEYKYRCEFDVRINWAEWVKQREKLHEIYGY